MRKNITITADALASQLSKTGRVRFEQRPEGVAVSSVQNGGVKLTTRSGRSTAQVTVGKELSEHIPEGGLRTIMTLDRNEEGNRMYLIKSKSEFPTMIAHNKA